MFMKLVVETYFHTRLSDVPNFLHKWRQTLFPNQGRQPLFNQNIKVKNKWLLRTFTLSYVLKCFCWIKVQLLHGCVSWFVHWIVSVNCQLYTHFSFIYEKPIFSLDLQYLGLSRCWNVERTSAVQHEPATNIPTLQWIPTATA